MFKASSARISPVQANTKITRRYFVHGILYITGITLPLITLHSRPRALLFALFRLGSLRDVTLLGWLRGPLGMPPGTTSGPRTTGGPSSLRTTALRHRNNVSKDNAMCFVRSWSARSHFAWIVQRGCYQSPKDDPLPQLLQTPMRSMACRRERLAEAEYQVCLCNADWCNRSLHSTNNGGLEFLLMTTAVAKLFLI